VGLRIDKEARELASEVAKLTGESESEAVHTALREKRDRLGAQSGGRRRPRTKEEFRRFMETKIWPLIPEEHRGKPPMTKAEREELLGYGAEGY